MSAYRKFRHIVRIRQMLRRWRKKTATAVRRPPCDMPAGHVAVTVGASFKRFVVRATYLNHPLFNNLLARAEEEFGFTNTGPLAIPCDESLFGEILRHLAHADSSVKYSRQNYHVGCRSHHDFWTDSRPLLHGGSNNNIW